MFAYIRIYSFTYIHFFAYIHFCVFYIFDICFFTCINIYSFTYIHGVSAAFARLFTAFARLSTDLAAGGAGAARPRPARCARLAVQVGGDGAVCRAGS